uniref:Intramembrane protease 2 (inferred by orthology to a C. elegans protein) n=1 Tax=Anisakis simplex TaxID=6269 RepID=A0A0M3J317_ANISI
LYGMALLCIIVGSIRSLWFVQRQIRKKKLIEASITVKEAKKFPITASCVLFGLYLFFKCDAECRQKIWEYLSANIPEKYMTKISKVLSFMPITPSSNSSMLTQNSTTTASAFNLAHLLSFINKANIMYLLLLLLCYEGYYSFDYDLLVSS